MSLTLTASYVNANDTTYAAKHGFMLKALDELLAARYNNKSPLVYANVTPEFPLGDCYSFGTPQNLRTIASQYINSKETGSGTVVYTYTASQVALVTGGDGYRSLNRKKILYGGQYWFMDESTNNPERFERYSVADIAVENYLDPITANKTAFTFRSHWDKFGCVRIHNGNRYTLDIHWQAFGTTSSIAPYGILSGRRLHQTGSFSFDASYLHITKPNDIMTYQADSIGQSAACMETAYTIMNSSDWLRYDLPDIDYDTTSRETASFTGYYPISLDFLYDWIIQTGNVRQICVDNTIGTVYRYNLHWDGLTNGGFRETGFVDQQFDSGYNNLLLSTSASFFLTRHYLIPESTNLLNTTDLTGEFVVSIPAPNLEQWPHLQNPLTYGIVGESTTTVYSPSSAGGSVSYKTYTHSSSLFDRNIYNKWNMTLKNAFPAQVSSSVFTTNESDYFKANGSIGKRIKLSLNTQSLHYGELAVELLNNAKVNNNTLQWVFASSLAKTMTRNRFVPFAYRKYQDAGSLIGGMASYTSHPEDTDMEGTPDKSGSQRRLNVFLPETTGMKIEGGDYIKTETAGMHVYAPTNNNYRMYEKTNEDLTWWLNANLAFTESQKLISWRMPRLIEHLNDLVKAINNVKEVFTLNIRHLYYKPLPANCFEYPFTLYGEEAWAIPTDWVCGRTEGAAGGNALTTWCSYWGVPTSTISSTIDALLNEERYYWYYQKSNRTSAYPFGRYANSVIRKKYTEYLNSANYFPPTVDNGISFFPKNAMTATDFRKLFGGISPYSSYKYVKKNDMLVAFSSLGIDIPAIPVGERYTPTYTLSSTLTKVNGTYLGNSTPAPEYEIPDNLTNGGNPIPASLYFRNALGAGSTWRKTVKDGEAFRLIKDTSTSKRRYYESQQTTTFGVLEWFVHEFDDGTSELTDNPLSDRNLAPQTVPVTGDLNTSNPAYETLTEIYSNYPVLLVAGPETGYNFAWTSPVPSYDPHSPNNYYSITAVPVAASASYFVKEVNTSDMPITVDKIKTWSGINHDTWHCQIVSRTGVLRA